MAVLTGPPRNYIVVGHCKKEEMVDVNLCCREVVKVIDRLWRRATTGTAGGGGPAAGEGAAEEMSAKGEAGRGGGRRCGDDGQHQVVRLPWQKLDISWKTYVGGSFDQLF